MRRVSLSSVRISGKFFWPGRKSYRNFFPVRKITGNSSRDESPGRKFLGQKFRPPTYVERRHLSINFGDPSLRPEKILYPPEPVKIYPRPLEACIFLCTISPVPDRPSPRGPLDRTSLITITKRHAFLYERIIVKNFIFFPAEKLFMVSMPTLRHFFVQKSL
jgi:hypothetical protein